jgi:hypothetical protein
VREPYTLLIGAPFKGVQALESSTNPIPFDPSILQSLRNAHINLWGAVETRHGVALKWQWTNTYTFSVYALIEANKPYDNQTFYLICNDAKVRSVDSTGVIATDDLFLTGTTTYTYCAIVPCAGRVIGTIGTECYLHPNDLTYRARLFNLDNNGSLDARSLGVRAGATASLTATIAGSLTGTYKYRLSYVNYYGSEGNVGPVSQITVSGKSITVSWDTNHPEPGNYKWVKIWRTKELTANPNSDFYFVGTASITATFIDNTPDSDLTDNTYFTDHFLPPVPAQILAVGRNRLAIAYNGTFNGVDHRGKVYFSNINDPDVFDFDPSTGVGTAVQVYEHIQDDITGIYFYRDRWLIWTRRAMYALYGDTTDDFVLVKISDGSGCIAPYSVIEVEGKVYWIGGQTIYAYDGATITDFGRYVRVHLKSHFQDIYGKVNYFCRAEYHPSRRQIWFILRDTEKTGAVKPCLVLVANLNLGELGFSVYDYGNYDFATTTDRIGDIYGWFSRATSTPVPDALRKMLKFTNNSTYIDFDGATTGTASITIYGKTSMLGDGETEQEITRFSVFGKLVGETLTMTVFCQDGANQQFTQVIPIVAPIGPDGQHLAYYDRNINLAGNQFTVEWSKAGVWGTVLYAIRLHSLRTRGGGERHPQG